MLIDGEEHFIMDLSNERKTQRETHSLRPNVYYELVNGVQLTLGNVCVQYYCQDKSLDSSPQEGEGKAPTMRTLNKERRSIDSDCTATPSPKSTPSSSHFSPPILQSFDNDPGKLTYINFKSN